MPQTEQKTYLINFQDNLDAYAQHAADARKEVEKLTKENEDLLASGTANEAQIQKSNAALRTAQAEYKNALKNVDLATKANKANKGSYEELYRQWQLAQTQLKLMGNGYEVNEKGVRTLSKAFIDQSKKVADAKKSLNDFGTKVNDGRMNVGMYGEALQNALGPMGGLFGRAAQGAKMLSTAFKALLANPIVLLIAAIVAALVGLFKAFKSTDSGATELAARMEQLKAVLDVIRQRAIALIGALTSLFKGEYKKAADQFKEAVAGVGDQIKQATKAAYDYAYALDAIEDAENNYISTAAENRNKIAKLEYDSQDRTKSTGERRKALQEAIDIGTAEAKHAQDLAKLKLDNEADYLARKAGLRKEDVLGFIQMNDAQQANASESLKNLRNANDEKFKNIEQLYAAWLDADTKFFDENKRNNSRLTGFEVALNEEREKAIKDREALDKAALDKQKKAIDEEIALRIAKGQNDTEAMKAALLYQYEQLAAQTEISETQRQLLRVQFENAILDIDRTAKEKLLAQDKEFREAGDEIKARDDAAYFETQRLRAANNVALLSQILDEEFAAFKKSADYKNATLAEQLLFDQQYTDAKGQLSDIRGDQLEKEVEAISNLFGAMAQLLGEQSAAGKAFAIAQTLIDTWRSAQAAFTGMVTSIPGPIGIAAGVVAAAAAVAMGLANVKKILAVKTPKGGGGGGGAGSVSTAGTSMAGAASRVTAKPLGATTLNTGTGAQQVKAAGETAALTADGIAQAIGKLPRPIVTVEDINAKTAEKNKVEVRATV